MEDRAGAGGQEQVAGAGGEDETAGAGGQDEQSGAGGQDEQSGAGGEDELAGAGGQEEGDGAGGDEQLASAGGEEGVPGGSQGDGSGVEEGVFGDGGLASTGSGGEDAFDRSLEDFDAILGAEQEVLARTGTGTAADEVFTEAAGVGAIGGIDGLARGAGAQQDGEPTGGSVGATASSGARTADRRPPDFVEDEPAVAVEGCNDEDTVARQLCELATDEEDPVLREQLWEEYNEYLKIVARQ